MPKKWNLTFSGLHIHLKNDTHNPSEGTNILPMFPWTWNYQLKITFSLM